MGPPYPFVRYFQRNIWLHTYDLNALGHAYNRIGNALLLAHLHVKCKTIYCCMTLHGFIVTCNRSKAIVSIVQLSLWLAIPLSSCTIHFHFPDAVTILYEGDCCTRFICCSLIILYHYAVRQGNREYVEHKSLLHELWTKWVDLMKCLNEKLDVKRGVCISLQKW